MENNTSKSITEFTDKLGKNKILVSVIACWLISFGIDILFQYLTNSIHIEDGIGVVIAIFFRIMIVFAVAQGLWNGDIWAKWGAVALSTLSAGMSLFAAQLIFTEPMKGMLMLTYVVLYGYVVVQLIINKETQAHFTKKKTN